MLCKFGQIAREMLRCILAVYIYPENGEMKNEESLEKLKS